VLSTLTVMTTTSVRTMLVSKVIAVGPPPFVENPTTARHSLVTLLEGVPTLPSFAMTSICVPKTHVLVMSKAVVFLHQSCAISLVMLATLHHALPLLGVIIRW